MELAESISLRPACPSRLPVLDEYRAQGAIVNLTITVKNLEAVQRKLDNLDRGDYLKGVADAGAQLLRAEMRRYPPPPPNSSYRRTGTLGKSWTQKVTGGRDGWLAAVGTLLKYAPYVQDETRQAECHQGRWQTVQSVAKDKQAEIFNFVKRAIGRWLAKG